ncbi:unnamed protein product, partial [Polarella glacialis]
MSSGEDGGTGALDEGTVAAQAAVAAAATAAAAAAAADAARRNAAPSTALVEQYGDLHEYGLSLGVDLDVDGDEDLSWAVQEAFNAPLASSWTEYMDDSGRAYYVKEGSSQSTWEHPMDSVYRELIEMIRQARSQKPALSEPQRTDLVRDHLRRVHHLAKKELEGWSGPYPSEQGEYYYNETLKVSTWESPVTECETELATRHGVLSRYLLPEQAALGVSSPSGDCTGGHSSASGGLAASKSSMLQALRLQLGNLHREPTAGDVPEPSTCRSFYTARSGASSRSGRAKHGSSASKERRKEKKSRREADEEGGVRRQLQDVPEGGSPDKGQIQE